MFQTRAFEAALQRFNVLSLPAFWPFCYFELHSLAFLQALEAARLDRREVHKNIFATLPADKAVAFGVVKPLYCSLFCHVLTSSFKFYLRWKVFGGTKGSVSWLVRSCSTTDSDSNAAIG